MITKRILFVDEETAVLDGLRRSLFRVRDRWEMHFASTFGAALKTLKGEEFDLVVSDLCEHKPDGLEFLRHVSKRWPAVVRVALTSNTEGSVALEALGITHQYLGKPVEAERIVQAVERATRTQLLLQGQHVGDVIKALERVPSLPESFRQLSRVIDDPDSDLGDAVDIIETDPGLAGGILKIVNSAFFGLPREIRSISEALNFIGVDMLRAAVLDSKLYDALSYPPDCIRAAEAMRRHAHEVGAAVRKLATQLGFNKKQQSELFLTGLVHDFGRLVMLSAYGKAYEALLREQPTEVQQCAAELERYGADHAVTGAYLLGLWGLSDETVNCIANHHNAAVWTGTDSLQDAALYAVTALSDGEGEQSGGIQAYAEVLQSAGNPIGDQIALAIAGIDAGEKIA